MDTTRRRFLQLTAAALAGAAALPTFAQPATVPAAFGGLALGIQSYSLRDRSFEKMLTALRDDLKLSAVEIYPGHIVGQNPKTVAELLTTYGVKAMSYGVVGFGRDDAKNRKEFELAKALGLTNLSCDPEDNDACWTSLEKLTEEFGITVAIHPHGPGHRWGSRAQLDKAFTGRSTRIGLCADTGHLIRSAEDPLAVMTAYKDRLHALHLKDFKKLEGDNKWEDVPAGQATLDVDAVVKFLLDQQFKGGVFIEYEGGNPVAQVTKSRDRVAEAVDKAKA